MEIFRWPARASIGHQPGTIVKVTKYEALRVIQSLTNQLLSGSPNGSGRLEFLTSKRHYFSIIITED